MEQIKYMYPNIVWICFFQKNQVVMCTILFAARGGLVLQLSCGLEQRSCGSCWRCYLFAFTPWGQTGYLLAAWPWLATLTAHVYWTSAKRHKV